jgi:hypothetical protein
MIRRHSWHVALPALTFVVCSTGCRSESREAEPWTVRDSSDVRIVENQVPAWGEGDEWRVADEPALEIGVEEGEEPYQLFRVSDAVRLADGRIVVSNAGSGELRFFDLEGRFLYSAGRHGQGPGEFGEFSSMRVWDSGRRGLVVTDPGNSRVNFFQVNGEYIGSTRVEALSGRSPPNVIGGFADGTWLAVGGGGRLVGATGQIIEGTREYFRYNSNGRPAESLFELATRPRYVNTLGNTTHYPFIPLTPSTAVAAGALWLFVGDGGTHEVQRRRLDGTINSLYRWPDAGRRRTADVYDRFKTESLDDISDPDRRRAYAHFFEQDLPIPELVPSFRGLLVDDVGNLWVEHYRLPWDARRTWEVFNPDGRWLGTLTTPLGVRPLQIGPDFLLGSHRDEVGVERVRLYELVKS